jgi:hypothetical protein
LRRWQLLEYVYQNNIPYDGANTDAEIASNSGGHGVYRYSQSLTHITDSTKELPIHTPGRNHNESPKRKNEGNSRCENGMSTREIWNRKYQRGSGTR